jgi:hypothetical protein
MERQHMRFKKALKITSRLSSVTNGFVQAIIPQRAPTDPEMTEALIALGMTPTNPRCVYCGAAATDWDHLHPLVRARRPTGYFHEIGNIVPACGPCNQSKGGQEWKVWMFGGARNSPRSKGVQNLEERAQVIEDYEHQSRATRLNFASIVPQQDWVDYWDRLSQIENLMRDTEILATRIAEKLQVEVDKLR